MLNMLPVIYLKNQNYDWAHLYSISVPTTQMYSRIIRSNNKYNGWWACKMPVWNHSNDLTLQIKSNSFLYSNNSIFVVISSGKLLDNPKQFLNILSQIKFGFVTYIKRWKRNFREWTRNLKLDLKAKAINN